MDEHQWRAVLFEAERPNLGRWPTRCSVPCHIGWVSLVTPMTKHHEGMEPMSEHEWLAEQFEAERPHLQAVAYRMLGDLTEADDAVQESWLHLSSSGTSGVKNLGGWLTTVVARICLDMLRLRKSRREESLEASEPEPIMSREGGIDPEHEALLVDSVGLALLVVLNTLSPAE